MSNRKTVLRFLKKELAERKHFLNSVASYNDLQEVYGGKKLSDQHILNLKKDIEQLEFCVTALKEKFCL